MTMVIKGILFLFGMSLCVQVIAALHGFIDLRYVLKTRYPQVLRRILMWSALTFLIAWALGDRFRPAFVWGIIIYPFFYTAAFIGFKLIPIRNKQLLNGDRQGVRTVESTRPA